MDPGVGRVLVESDARETFAVVSDGLRRSIVTDQRLEIFEQRRADTPEQVIGFGHIHTEPLERKLNRARDADHRVGQGTVEIEEDGPTHAQSLSADWPEWDGREPRGIGSRSWTGDIGGRWQRH